MRETHHLLIADRIRDVVEFLLTRDSFHFFLLHFAASFCRVLASVCGAQLRLCVNELIHCYCCCCCCYSEKRNDFKCIHITAFNYKKCDLEIFCVNTVGKSL